RRTRPWRSPRARHIVPDPAPSLEPPDSSLFACLYLPNPANPANLVNLAQGFSPRYESHGDRLVTIDVSGLGRLLGPPRVIGDELRADAARRGMRVHVAIAGTHTAARLLALARPGLTIVDRGGEAEATAPIPIGILEKISDEPGLQEMFRRWGLK